MPSFDQKSGHFCIKNLKIFSLKNFPKKKYVGFFKNIIFFRNIFLQNYDFFEVWKIFMHKNAIKKVGGVKISEISPQNEGFFGLKLWDFQH